MITTFWREIFVSFTFVRLFVLTVELVDVYLRWRHLLTRLYVVICYRAFVSSYCKENASYTIYSWARFEEIHHIYWAQPGLVGRSLGGGPLGEVPWGRILGEAPWGGPLGEQESGPFVG